MSNFNDRINVLIALSDELPDENKRPQTKRVLEELGKAIQHNTALENVLSQFESELPKEIRRSA